MSNIEGIFKFYGSGDLIGRAGSIAGALNHQPNLPMTVQLTFPCFACLGMHDTLPEQTSTKDLMGMP